MSSGLKPQMIARALSVLSFSDAMDSKVGHSDEGAKYFSLVLSRSAGIGVVRG